MHAVSRRALHTALTVSVASAAVAVAGPSLAGAAALAKPVQAGGPGKAPPAHGSAQVKAGRGEGIVQSVSANAIVLRELDGSTVSISVATSTHVFVDGKQASLHDVEAGFVASASWKTGGSARVLQAFDLSGRHAVSVGVVDSVSSSVLVLTKTSGTAGAGGTTVSIRVNAKTHVLVDGEPATLAAVKAGFTVVISSSDSKGTKPAHELLFLQPV
jgi:hypothetical protein